MRKYKQRSLINDLGLDFTCTKRYSERSKRVLEPREPYGSQEPLKYWGPSGKKTFSTYVHMLDHSKVRDSTKYH